MTTNAPQATLLHLTDLHFGAAKFKGHYWNSEATELQRPKHDRRGLLGSLIDDLHLQKIKPDLVLVTGDLLDRGASYGIRLVRDFLDNLAKELGLERSRVVLIPGNHDVLRIPDVAKQYQAFDSIRNGFYGALRKPFEVSVPPYHRVELFDYSAELGIEVVAFNSCEALDSSAQQHGSVGPAQRRRAETLLAVTEGKIYSESR